MIQFNCSQCSQSIQVPEEARGKQAQCPYCKAVQLVTADLPSLPRTPVQDSKEQALRHQMEQYEDSGNPYEPPPLDTDVRGDGPVEAAEPVPTRVPIGAMLSAVWQFLSKRFGDHLVFGVLVILLMMGYSFLTLIFMSSVGEAFGMHAMQYASGLFAVLFMPLFLMGIIRRGIFVARNGKGRYEMIFTSIRFWLRGVCLTLISYVLFLAFQFILTMPGRVLLGLSLDPLDFELPQEAFAPENQTALIFFWVGYVFGALLGSLLYVRIGFAYHFVVDRDMGVMEAIRSSWTFTKGNMAAIILAYFAMGLVVLVLCLICVGVLIAYGYFISMFGLMYLKITGQPNLFEDPRWRQSEY